jgi:hypothetical protein
MLNEISVKFEPLDSRQKIQGIIADFPEDLPPKKITLRPPFETDLEDRLGELAKVLKSRLSKLPPVPQPWECADSFPFVLSIDYVSSSGELQTSRLLYVVDFRYGTQLRCETETSCIPEKEWYGRIYNVRYERILRWFEDPRSVVQAVMAKRKFKFENRPAPHL